MALRGQEPPFSSLSTHTHLLSPAPSLRASSPYPCVHPTPPGPGVSPQAQGPASPSLVPPPSPCAPLREHLSLLPACIPMENHPHAARELAAAIPRVLPPMGWGQDGSVPPQLSHSGCSPQAAVTRGLESFKGRWGRAMSEARAGPRRLAAGGGICRRAGRCPRGSALASRCRGGG